MKKIISVLMAAVLLLPLTACSGGASGDLDSFRSAPSALSGLFSDYFVSAENDLLRPSSDAHAESEIRYSYNTEDGVKTEYIPISAVYSKDGDSLYLSFNGHTVVFGKTAGADGSAVRSISDERSGDIISAFISDFCAGAGDADIEAAPDSIRASDDDVEVTRYTVKLGREQYLRAFDRALSGLDREKEYLTDVLGLYAFLHEREESGEQLYEKLISAVKDAVKAGKDTATWQRYVKKTGKVPEAAAAVIKVGDSTFRYLCAETKTYKELNLYAELDGKTFELAYEKRSTGMSDSYNVRISSGDEITYFDGETSSAYKSGGVKFELLATKNAVTLNGLNFTLDFNGLTSLTYDINGNYVRSGERTDFAFSLVFGDGAADAPTVTGESVSPGQALEKLFSE